MKKITLLFVCLIPTITFAQPGTIDFSFNTGIGPDTSVFATATQPDGRIIIAGTFDNYNGTPRSGIARVNTDGTLDTSFDPGTGLPLSTNNIYCLALQPDGKVMIGGNFANFNGTPRKNIARLNADGSVDISFDPGTGANSDVISISLQSTGKIIAAGLFTTFNATAKKGVLRLNPDGTIDTSFLSGPGVNSYVWTTSVLPDDRIYIGGGFTAYNNISCGHFNRLNADGSPDPTFSQTRYTNNTILTHTVQPDGKIVIGGYFTTYDPGTPTRLARINNDGTFDPTFNVGTGLNDYPLTIVAQPNGKILVGGAFVTYNGTTVNRLVRLNSDATIDASFISPTGLNGIVYHAMFQPDGKIIIASGATIYNSDTTKPNLVRINGYAANAIAVGSLSAAAPFCAGQALAVNYTAPGFYASGNIFTAQLSDALGSFAAPVAIGTLNATGDGAINVTIPSNTAAGSGYRIRVISSNIATIGTDNGSDLAIAVPSTYYADADNDTYGNPAVTQTSCTPAVGYVPDNTDCNDANANVNPGVAEIPGDGIDNNCNGQTDENGQITTSLLPSFCNSTLASIGSLIGITTLAPGAEYTGYRIRLTNGAQVQVIEKNVPHFTLAQFPVYAYATTYTVEIQLQRNGIWLGYYGPACQVSSPAVLAPGGAASVSPSQCGATLPKINTLISTTSLAGVSGYRFRITNITPGASGPNIVQTIDRVQNWFSLQMLTEYNYGSTYQIEIAIKTGAGQFGGFGSACEVSSPAALSLANCGGIVATNTTNVATASVPGAMQYRFEITRQSDNASTILDRSSNFFTFNSVPTPIFTAGSLYNVRVAVMTTGSWSPFGNSCQITSPGAAPLRMSGETVTESGEWKATVYPNPFSADFSVEISGASEKTVQLRVYDMIGREVESKEMQASELNSQKTGSQYPSGVYNVIVSQGGIVKTLRVVKR